MEACNQSLAILQFYALKKLPQMPHLACACHFFSLTRPPEVHERLIYLHPDPLPSSNLTVSQSCTGKLGLFQIWIFSHFKTSKFFQFLKKPETKKSVILRMQGLIKTGANFYLIQLSSSWASKSPLTTATPSWSYAVSPSPPVARRLLPRLASPTPSWPELFPHYHLERLQHLSSRHWRSDCLKFDMLDLSNDITISRGHRIPATISQQPTHLTFFDSFP